MCSILMSIKPEFAQEILAGKKIYEFRKRACKKNVEKIYIYSTVPVQKVVGEAEVETILIENPAKLWSLTKAGAGIDKAFFDQYYQDRKVAVAYKLTNVIEYETPKSLRDLGVKNAPQSYQYVR